MKQLSLVVTDKASDVRLMGPCAEKKGRQGTSSQELCPHPSAFPVTAAAVTRPAQVRTSCLWLPSTARAGVLAGTGAEQLLSFVLLHVEFDVCTKSTPRCGGNKPKSQLRTQQSCAVGWLTLPFPSPGLESCASRGCLLTGGDSATSPYRIGAGEDPYPFLKWPQVSAIWGQVVFWPLFPSF